MTGVVLETERLFIRRWRETDRGPFAELNADPEVMEHFPSLLSRTESDTLVDRIEAKIDADGFGFWAVECRDTGAFVGFTGIRPTDLRGALHAVRRGRVATPA